MVRESHHLSCTFVSDSALRAGVGGLIGYVRKDYSQVADFASLALAIPHKYLSIHQPTECRPIAPLGVNLLQISQSPI